MGWQDKYKHKLITAKEAAGLVKSGDVVVFPLFLQPKDIGDEIAKRKDELRHVTLVSHWSEDYPWFRPGMEESFTVKDGFIFPHARQAAKEKRTDWVPAIFGISDGLRQAEPGRSSLYHYANIHLVQVTPPNKSGYCSFGHAPWWSPTAVKTAHTVIAEINPKLPWTFGEYVHISELDYLVEAREAQLESKPGLQLGPTDEDFHKSQIVGKYVVSLIKDGDTLEIGTGLLPEAVMDFLKDRNDLGIDSEMIFVKMIDLIKEGVITGKRKNVNQGKVVNTALLNFAGQPGSSEVFDFVENNPIFEFRDVSYICNVPRIASNDNMVSINSAVAIDLIGQTVISHLGPIPISGPGGQVEYNIGSHYSKGGRSITCLLSTAKDGTVSRIVPQLESGTGVLLPLYYVDWLVTEHGMVNLECKSRRERAEAIISVAHPDFRTELKKAAKKLFWPD